MNPRPAIDSPWWMRELKEALKGYGLAVIIVLVGLAFMWWHGGEWVRGQATMQEAIVKDWKEFQTKVSEDHRVGQAEARAHTEILREITGILDRMCREGTGKNGQMSPAASGAG